MLRPIIALLIAASAVWAQDASLESLKGNGQWKEVRSRVQGWYRTKPEDPYAVLWMSRVKQAFGDPNGALDLARRAVALRPSDPDFQAQLGMAAGYAAGSADGKMKQFSLAREMKKALESSLEAKLDNEEAAQYLLVFYLQAPGLIGGGEGKAKDLASKMTALRPVEGLLMQSTIAFQTKKLEAAKGFIQQALAQDPKSYDAHMALTNYHLAQKPQALDAAVGALRQAIAAKPKGAQAHALLASILAEQGKWAELDAAFAQAQKAIPGNPLPYYSVGRNLIYENKFLDKAEGFLRTFLSQDPEGAGPDQATAHWRLGQLFEKLGRRPEALKELEMALKLRPEFPSAKKDWERLSKG